MSWYRFPDYLSVAERREQAAKEVKKLRKKGQILHPIAIEGRLIASTLWGKAWCKNLELYSNDEYRLQRGRSYVRHGAVIDLKIAEGKVTALVSGASLYKVEVEISAMATTNWNKLVTQCANKIDSLIELLQGKFSKGVMAIIIDPQHGLFPQPQDIKFNCSCLDWADMCKHVAAVLYGIGSRLDHKPEELFILRQADYIELISKAGTTALTTTAVDNSDQPFVDGDLAALFDIDMGDTVQQEPISKHSSVPSKTKKLASAMKTKRKPKTVRKKQTAEN